MSAATFSLLESRGRDGVVELRPSGELDLAVAHQFSHRLAELVGEGARVRLDLSHLQFIDSAGIHALLRAVMEGRGDAGQLVVVDRNLTRSVQRVIELVDAGPALWPAGDGSL